MISLAVASLIAPNSWSADGGYGWWDYCQGHVHENNRGHENNRVYENNRLMPVFMFQVVLFRRLIVSLWRKYAGTLQPIGNRKELAGPMV